MPSPVAAEDDTPGPPLPPGADGFVDEPAYQKLHFVRWDGDGPCKLRLMLIAPEPGHDRSVVLGVEPPPGQFVRTCRVRFEYGKAADDVGVVLEGEGPLSAAVRALQKVLDPSGTVDEPMSALGVVAFHAQRPAEQTVGMAVVPIQGPPVTLGGGFVGVQRGSWSGVLLVR